MPNQTKTSRKAKASRLNFASPFQGSPLRIQSVEQASQSQGVRGSGERGRSRDKIRQKSGGALRLATTSAQVHSEFVLRIRYEERVRKGDNVGLPSLRIDECVMCD